MMRSASSKNENMSHAAPVVSATSAMAHPWDRQSIALSRPGRTTLTRPSGAPVRRPQNADIPR